MAIQVHLEDMNHGRVRSFVDDEAESLRALSDRAYRSRAGMLTAINPHSDGMLNVPQLNILIEELDALLKVRGLTAGEREMCVQLAGAAYETVRRRGFLYFQGD
jgi:hypothetical protein